FINSEPSPTRALNKLGAAVNSKLTASGLTAIWARENTREELFNSLVRREVYATTGTRVTVRFFGGWEYDDQAVFRSDYVNTGYAKGDPMGQQLVGASGGSPPTIMVVASKDPDGANLDR